MLTIRLFEKGPNIIIIAIYVCSINFCYVKRFRKTGSTLTCQSGIFMHPLTTLSFHLHFAQTQLSRLTCWHQYPEVSASGAWSTSEDILRCYIQGTFGYGACIWHGHVGVMGDVDDNTVCPLIFCTISTFIPLYSTRTRIL